MKHTITFDLGDQLTADYTLADIGEFINQVGYMVGMQPAKRILLIRDDYVVESADLSESDEG